MMQLTCTSWPCLGIKWALKLLILGKITRSYSRASLRTHLHWPWLLQEAELFNLQLQVKGGKSHSVNPWAICSLQWTSQKPSVPKFFLCTHTVEWRNCEYRKLQISAFVVFIVSDFFCSL